MTGIHGMRDSMGQDILESEMHGHMGQDVLESEKSVLEANDGKRL